MLQFDVTHALPFLPKNWMSSRLDGLTEACNLLERGNGLGGQFTGWVKLPETYDRQEVQRLLQTAQIIRKQSDVLIVIGIGGSYLGSRALLELLASPHYNLLARKTPQIFFTGNTLSSDAMTELLDYVRGEAARLGMTPNAGEIIGGHFIAVRFGCWKNVVTAAGLVPPKKQKPLPKRQIFKEELRCQARERAYTEQQNSSE